MKHASGVPTTRDEVIAYLREQNPRAALSIVVIYADALESYREASKNISENGAVVIHPRTGAPISNPYLPVQDKARAVLRKMSSIKADKLWS